MKAKYPGINFGNQARPIARIPWSFAGPNKAGGLGEGTADHIPGGVRVTLLTLTH